MFNPSNNNSYKEISSTLATIEPANSEPLAALKIEMVVSWIKSNHRFFTDLLNNKLFDPQTPSSISLKVNPSIKQVINFKKNLKAIIETENKNNQNLRKDHVKDAPPQDIHSKFLESIFEINDNVVRAEMIGSRKNFSLLYKVLKENSNFTEFFQRELPKLNDVVKTWEASRFPQFCVEIVNWTKENKFFLKALLNSEIIPWLENKIKSQQELLQQQQHAIDLLRQEFKAKVNVYQNAQKQEHDLLTTLKQSGIAPSKQKKVEQALTSLKPFIEATKKSLIELKKIANLTSDEYRASSKSVEIYKQQGRMVFDFIVELETILKDTKIESKNNLLQDEKLTQILLDNHTLLKFLIKHLHSFDDVISEWKKTQKENQNHIITEMDSAPTISNEVPLKGTKRKDFDGKDEVKPEKTETSEKSVLIKTMSL